MPDMPYPDLPVPGMYSQLQKMKIKEFDVFSCGDSLCLTKDLTSFLLFNPDGRVEREVYVDEDKNVPYEIYTYPDKNRIVKKINTDEAYWITHEYTLNEKGQVIKQVVRARDNFELEDNYVYKDSLLEKEIITDVKGTSAQGDITISYEYENHGWLMKSYASDSSDITIYGYDGEGRIIKRATRGTDPNSENKTIRYYYSHNKLVRKTEESYYESRKNDIKKSETTFTYSDNGLFNTEEHYSVKKNKRITLSYSYK
jgi:hypothetical protein